MMYSFPLLNSGNVEGEFFMKNTKELHEYALSLLHERGVELEEIAKLVHFLQEPYFPNLTLEHCYNNVEFVLKKREVQNAIITGIELDKLAEKNQLSQPLNDCFINRKCLWFNRIYKLWLYR